MENKQPAPNQSSMKTQTQPKQANSGNNKLLVTIAASILLTATVAGSVVYFWQKSVSEKEISVLRKKVVSLEKQVSTMQKERGVPLPTPTPATDSTSDSDWKTYQNEKVIFKFPPQWTQKPILIRGSGFTQEFKDPENKFSLIFLSNGNYNQTTGKPYTTIDEYINMPHKVKVVTIDGREGRQTLPRAGSENVNVVMFFSKDSKFIYALELQTGSTSSDASETDVEEGKKLFDQILSTFKFAN